MWSVAGGDSVTANATMQEGAINNLLPVPDSTNLYKKNTF